MSNPGLYMKGHVVAARTHATQKAHTHTYTRHKDKYMHNKKMMPILDKMINKIVSNKEVVNDGMVWITCTIFLLFYCHEQTVFSITISFKKNFHTIYFDNILSCCGNFFRQRPLAWVLGYYKNRHRNVCSLSLGSCSPPVQRTVDL